MDARQEEKDWTPPHGIHRPTLTPLQAARVFVADEIGNAPSIYSAEELAQAVEPLRTLADALDALEALVSLYTAEDADGMDLLVGGVARDFLGWHSCPFCNDLTDPDDWDAAVGACAGCAEDDETPEECDRCGNTATPSGLTLSASLGWLCPSCDGFVHGVATNPDHPFGGALDR